jgi:hypothetical protein
LYCPNASHNKKAAQSETRRGHRLPNSFQGLRDRALLLVGSPPVRPGEVFANQEKALGWLQSPNQSLAGQTPLEAAATEEGFHEAEEVLTRIECGVLG